MITKQIHEPTPNEEVKEFTYKNSGDIITISDAECICGKDITKLDGKWVHGRRGF